MKDLSIRLISGSIYVALIIASIIFSPLILFIFFGLLSMVGLWEFYNNSKHVSVFPQLWLGFLIGILTYIYIGVKPYTSLFAETYTILPAIRVYILLIILFLVGLTFILELYRQKGKPFHNIAYTILGVIYIVLPLSIANLIPSTLIDQSYNYYYPSLLLGVFIMVWTNDSFAYLFGVRFGKRKLFERISPNKSWEGFVAGLVFVQIASIIIHKLSSSPLMFYDWMIMGLIVTVFGTFGDLVESMFKRQMGIKDSGKIMPGHGGMLDRFDILFLVIPIVFIYIYLRLN